MELNDVLAILKKHQDALIEIMLPSGEMIPDHFHITEVGRVQKDFIDCGGTARRTVHATLQAWTADDYDHRLKSGKLADIINISKNAVNFMDGDLPLQVEYGEDYSVTYLVSNVEITSNGVLFVLSGNKTDCLAKDKCGVKGCC
jgi:hypothetical protein